MNYLQFNDRGKFEPEEQALADYFGEGEYKGFYKKHFLIDEVDPNFISEELSDNRFEESKKLKGNGNMRNYREAKGLTADQERCCVNEAAYFIDAGEVPTVNELLKDFDSDDSYIDCFGANQIAAAKRIVELCKMGYDEFFERYHNMLDDSTMLADYYDNLDEYSFSESTRTRKSRVRESSAPSDVIDALHELKRAIKQYKNRQSILDYIINDLTEAFL